MTDRQYLSCTFLSYCVLSHEPVLTYLTGVQYLSSTKITPITSLQCAAFGPGTRLRSPGTSLNDEGFRLTSREYTYCCCGWWPLHRGNNKPCKFNPWHPSYHPNPTPPRTRLNLRLCVHPCINPLCFLWLGSEGHSGWHPRRGPNHVHQCRGTWAGLYTGGLLLLHLLSCCCDAHLNVHDPPDQRRRAEYGGLQIRRESPLRSGDRARAVRVIPCVLVRVLPLQCQQGGIGFCSRSLTVLPSRAWSLLSSR